MKEKKDQGRGKWSALLLSLLAVAGFSAGAAGFLMHGTGQASAGSALKENASGQSYGSAANVDAQNQPDLIWVEGDNGKSGYVRKADMENSKDMPKNPAEAVAFENRREVRAAKVFTSTLSSRLGVSAKVEETRSLRALRQAQKYAANGKFTGGQVAVDEVGQTLGLPLKSTKSGNAKEALSLAYEAAEASEQRVVPVYDKEGKVKIDTFTIG